VCTYFKSNEYFGYYPESIVFFPQGGIPAVSYDGKIVIESEGQVSLAPGGNGAIYGEMKNRGVLEHMNKHGVKYIYLGPVDNVLLKVGDPLSLGYMVQNHFDIVSHYILKRNPSEKVGLHVSINSAVKIC
jgi:UDP-N-acetylglucosamine/UDP-N-acetylgalactosamine diphosphorylase